MYRTLALALTCWAATIGAASASETLSGEALRSAIVDKTVYVDTPIGAVPINFKGDGSMSGRSPALAAYAVATTDRGRWWITSNRLCQRWDTWFDKSTQCYAMRRVGQTLHWSRSDGRVGTARLAR